MADIALLPNLDYLLCDSSADSNSLQRMTFGTGSPTFSPVTGLLGTPEAMIVTTDGGVWIASESNNDIEFWSTNNVNETEAITVIGGGGFGQSGYMNGPLAVALFSGPNDVIPDSLGNFVVVDTSNSVVRYIDFSMGTVATIAGSIPTGSGCPGYADSATGLQAKFCTPIAAALGPDGTIYVADQGNNRVRAIAAVTARAVTTLAGSGANASMDGPAAQAEFSTLWGIAVDSQGAVYVTDSSSTTSIDDSSIRVISADSVTTLALDTLGGTPLQKIRYVSPNTLITVDQTNAYSMTLP